MKPEWVIAGAILLAVWAIAKTLEELTARHIAAINRLVAELDRVGTKLDNLWSPLVGIQKNGSKPAPPSNLDWLTKLASKPDSEGEPPSGS